MVWLGEDLPFLSVPLDVALQAGIEVYLRFPSESPCPADVERPAEWAFRLAPVVEHLLRRVTRGLKYQVRDIPNLVSLLPAKVYRGAVCNLLRGQDRSAHDVFNERKASLLIARAPHFVGILTVEGFLHEGRDGVAGIQLPGPIYRQVPADRGLESSLRPQDRELQLPHQFGEPVQLVAAVPSLPRAQSLILSKEMSWLVER